MPHKEPPFEPMLKSSQVAALFHVDVRTVTRWAVEGKLSSVRTPGNQRRFREAEVLALLRGETSDAG